MTQALRAAFSRTMGRLFWGQWLGNFVLMLLAAAWLQIPDSHSWQFTFSVLSAVLLVAAFLWIYMASFRYLLPCGSRPRWWLGCLWLAMTLVVWWFLLQSLHAGRTHEAVFAGYWNSRSPAWLRAYLGYSSLVAWQERIYDGIQWILAGLLLPLAMETAACGSRSGWFRRAAGPYRRWLYWVCVLLFGWAASTLTWALASWTPEAGLVEQSFSVLTRLAVAYTADMLLWCFLLSLAAHYVRPAADSDL